MYSFLDVRAKNGHVIEDEDFQHILPPMPKHINFVDILMWIWTENRRSGWAPDRESEKRNSVDKNISHLMYYI